jgi:hypothetical protein
MTPTREPSLICSYCGALGRLVADQNGFFITAHCGGPELGCSVCFTAVHPTIEAATKAWNQFGYDHALATVENPDLDETP